LEVAWKDDCQLDKVFHRLEINTALGDIPAVEPVNGDTERVEVEGGGDGETEKNADLEVEEEEAEEEVSQHDKEAQPVEDAGEDEPADPDSDKDQEQDGDTDQVENKQEEENEEASPDADLEDQEIELQPAHRAEALDVLASIEFKFDMLRERVYVEEMEILAWEESMIQACEFLMLSISPRNLYIFFSCSSNLHPANSLTKLPM